MENSIEEDIKKLRESIIEEKYHIFNKDLKIILEHILSDYKRALKENETLKNKLLDTLEGQKVIEEETPQYIKENYILKEKVKDKIEEIQKDKDSKYYDMFLETRDIEYVVEILQELLRK